MSQLESEASKLLKPMLDEKLSLGLSVDSQELLAVWTTKTAMMIQFTQGTRAIPVKVYHELFRSRKPPRRSVIYVARKTMEQMPNGSHSINWRVGIGEHALSAVDQGEMYAVTFFIKNLVLQIIGYELRTAFDPNVEFPQRFQPYVQRLWPPWLSVRWPPENPSLDDRSALQFAFALNEMRRRPLI